MKRTIVLFLLSAIVVMSSCKKSVKTDSIAPLYIPWNMDSLMLGADAYINGVSKLNVSGVMVACTLYGSIIDTSGQINVYTRNWENAIFAGSPNSFTGGVGNVSVNNIPLDTGMWAGFAHHDSAPVWNENTINHWYISGSGSVPVISADISGILPVFSGTLPSKISKTSDFSFTFNATNNSFGDSAFVIVYGSITPTFGIGDPVYSNVVSANGGTAVIRAIRLRDTDNGLMPLIFNAQTSPVYYGGIIMLVIYNHSIQTFGGKKFAFVKQREIMGLVRFY